VAELIIRLTGSNQPLKFLPLPDDDPTRRRPVIDRAITLLDWRPDVRLKVGLKKTIPWFAGLVGRPAAPTAAACDASVAAAARRVAGSPPHSAGRRPR
jgi:dTDP-glucose 4,6-dehydratase